MSRNYYRAFLPVKQERSDYSLGGHEAVGRIIIEAKGDAGKISLTMRGVKKNSQMELYLIAGVSNEYIGVYIGKLMIDEHGKGECKHEFNADNVKKSGMAVEAFTIAALMVPKEGELIAPFVGYKNETTTWKVNFKYFTEIKTQEAAATEVEAEKDEEAPYIADETETPEEIKEIEKADVTGVVDVIEEAETTEAIEEVIIEAEEVVEIAEEAEVTKEEPEKTEEINNDPHKKFKNFAMKFNKQSEEFKAVEKQDDIPPINEEITKLFETNTIMYPFKQKKSDVTWVRVSPKGLMKLPPEIGRHANCPLVLNGFRSFKHLIFGKFCQDGIVEFLIGVPDIYYEQKKYSAAEYGFHKFECCDGEEVFNGAYGYWVMVI